MSDAESEFDSIRGHEADLRGEINDSEVVVVRSDYPSGVRDFVLHLRTESETPRVLNPLELLGTNMAVRVINFLGRESTQSALQFALSRLLVQCLEYRGNTRHLIVEDWTDNDLRGEHLFEGNRTDFARDCSVEQAQRYNLVMCGAESPQLTAADQYWGTFSRLPPVEDMFDDPELGALAIQLMEKIEGQGEGNVSVDIAWLRSLLSQCWRENFSNFDLNTGVRQRRVLFKKLMSVAVRQSSTMTRQVAYAVSIRNLDASARTAFQLSDREERLFEIRYGSYRPLGNINIGFLFGDGELHTELLNSLGRSLVSGDPEETYLAAEEELYRHVQLLGELRDHRREARAEQRRTTRLNRARRLPQARVVPEGQEDVSSPSPEANIRATESLAVLEQVLPLLNERDRERVEAIINAGGDRRAAAELLNVDPVVFMRRYRQTTQHNVNAALERVRQQEEDQ